MQILKKNQTKNNSEDNSKENIQEKVVEKKTTLKKIVDQKEIRFKEKKEINIQNNNQHKKEVWFAS